MTREEYNKLRSWREHPCPDCGSYATRPRPGCHCLPNENGYGTMHINREHHTCEKSDLEAHERDLERRAGCGEG